jgi:hypothetical protein
MEKPYDRTYVQIVRVRAVGRPPTSTFHAQTYSVDYHIIYSNQSQIHFVFYVHDAFSVRDRQGAVESRPLANVQTKNCHSPCYVVVDWGRRYQLNPSCVLPQSIGQMILSEQQLPVS